MGDVRIRADMSLNCAKEILFFLVEHDYSVDVDYEGNNIFLIEGYKDA